MELGTPVGSAAACGIAGNAHEQRGQFQLEPIADAAPQQQRHPWLCHRKPPSSQKTLTASFSMTYALGEKLSAILHYQFIDVDSDCCQ